MASKTGVRKDCWQYKEPKAWKKMLTMLADGKNPPEIWKATGIPKQTINTHLRKYGRGTVQSKRKAEGFFHTAHARIPAANMIFGGMV